MRAQLYCISILLLSVGSVANAQAIPYGFVECGKYAKQNRVIRSRLEKREKWEVKDLSIAQLADDVQERIGYPVAIDNNTVEHFRTASH